MADESKAAAATDGAAAAASTVNQEWQLASYAEGDVTVDHLALVTIDTPAGELDEGMVHLKLAYLSVDPYMRGKMRDTKSYGGHTFTVGKPLMGFCIATVLRSADSDLKEGDTVHGFFPWKRQFIHPGSQCRKLDMSMTPTLPPSVYLGVLGLTGVSAYLPIVKIAEPKEGDVVFVSGAAGAVGSVAGQVFKLMGCRVIGSAGSDEKVAHVKSLGFDDAFNYKTEDAEAVLKRFAPEGLNVYWDNVGGPMLDTVLTRMARYGRIVSCGMISQYNKRPDERYGIKNLISIVGMEVKIQGFIVSTWQKEFPTAIAALAAWLMKGQLQFHETVIDGFDNTAEALIGLFKGANTGKMVVKV